MDGCDASPEFCPAGSGGVDCELTVRQAVSAGGGLLGVGQLLAEGLGRPGVAGARVLALQRLLVKVIFVTSNLWEVPGNTTELLLHTEDAALKPAVGERVLIARLQDQAAFLQDGELCWSPQEQLEGIKVLVQGSKRN